MYKLLTAILFLFINTATAQPLTPLLGTWTGTGKLFNMDATFTMTWETALNGKFIRLTFQNNFTQNGKQSTMNAEAMYKPLSDTTFIGTWFDSRGITFPLKATLTGNTLTTEWGSPETESGKTVYHIKSNSEMEVTDFVKRNGQYQQFGKATYQNTTHKGNN